MQNEKCKILGMSHAMDEFFSIIPFPQQDVHVRSDATK